MLEEAPSQLKNVSASILDSRAKPPERDSVSDSIGPRAARGAGTPADSPAPVAASTRFHCSPIILSLAPLAAALFILRYLSWDPSFASAPGIEINEASGKLPESRTKLFLSSGVSAGLPGASPGRFSGDGDVASLSHPSRTKRKWKRTSARSTSRRGGKRKPRGKRKGPRESAESNATAQELFDMWTRLYQVEEGSKRKLQMVEPDGTPAGRRPVEAEPLQRLVVHLNATSSVPRAPHLQCCDELTILREQADKRGPKGELPGWMTPQPGSNKSVKPYPRPPWVKGTPEDNLPLTHQAQADIWQHQHPADGCAGNGTRFLVSWWDYSRYHGIGSHLHLMTTMLGMAMIYGRVFGLLNDTFARAEHDGCKGPNYGSYACYFRLPLSNECDRRAMEIWKGHNETWRSQRYFTDKVAEASMKGSPNLLDRIAGSEPYLVISPRFAVLLSSTSFVPTMWGKPWLSMKPSLAYRETDTLSPRMQARLELGWWRAQGVRYFLRWPSAYLCHIVNFARHQTYGMEAAKHALAQPTIQGGGAPPPTASWPSEKGGICNLEAEKSNDSAAAYSAEVFSPEPWIPRPVVRVHVRGTDKRIEMRLLSAHDYLRAAEEVRVLLPPTGTGTTPAALWLSSEEKNAIDAARRVLGWRLYTLSLERKYESGKNMSIHQWFFAIAFGLREYVEASLANLMISQHSDGFVLALQSNWDRLANELRMTNGRLHVPIKVVNQGEA